MSTDMADVNTLKKRVRSSVHRYESAITKPILIEESIPQTFVRHVSIIIAVGVLTFIGWASISKVHEVSRASGTITPAGLERTIQHLEGGIIEAVLVEPGDLVEQGTSLFLLNDASTAEDVSTLSNQRSDILGQLAALTALADNTEPDFSTFGPDAAAIVRTNTAAYETARDARDARLQLLQSQIEQADASRAAIERQIVGLSDEYQFAAIEMERIEKLVAKEYAPRSLLAEKNNALTKIDNQIGVFRERLQLATSNLFEAKQNLVTYSAETRADLTRRIQELRSSLSALDGEVRKKERRQARLQVLAPTRGIIKSIEFTTIGGVVESGQPLATIVPVDEELFAEARVPVDQIGHLSIGLPAQVKVSAYDFTRFGWIDGSVASISPSAFREDGLKAYYKIRIRLHDRAPSHAPDAQILPGMEIAADIITGEKTILEYLLSPVRKALGSSFAER
jgi:adhesin transport system membrane fusion protein